MDFDVCVVGSGPAGAACARDLAQAGASVVLLDRAAPPRYKTCGGGIVGRVVEALDFDVGACIERRLHRIEVRLDGEPGQFAVERSPAPVVMVMRAEFDARLSRAACDAGARLEAPASFRGLSRGAAGLDVLTDRGKLKVTWVVGADGAGGRVARSAGFSEALHTIPAIESEIRVPQGVFERFAAAARFDLGIPPDGYGWVFPKAGHLSVGCLSTRRRGRAPDLNGRLDAYLRRLGLDGWIEREDHGFVIPIRPRNGRLARDGVLLVGDAAGLADPVTGEGISNAVRSGRLAARAVRETRHAPDRTGALYQRLLEAEVLGELRWARRLAPLLYGAPRVRKTVFRRAGSELCEAFTDIFTGRRTYRELLTRPRSYRSFLSALIRRQRRVDSSGA